MGLTSHKWKADTTKLKGIGKADDPDEGVGETDDLDMALLGLHVCIYIKISCAPCLVLIKKTPTRKEFQKIRS